MPIWKKNNDEKWLKIAQKNWKNRDKYRAAIGKIEKQENLIMIASSWSDDGMREAAIERIDDPEVLLKIALGGVREANNPNYFAKIVGRRFLQLGKPSCFFPVITRLTSNRDKIAIVAFCTFIEPFTDHSRDFRQAVQFIDDTELLRSLSWMFRDKKPMHEIVADRVLVLGKKAAEQQSVSLSEKEKLAYVLDDSKEKEKRLGMIEMISEDKTLAKIIQSDHLNYSAPKFNDTDILTAAAKGFRDPEALKEATVELSHDRYQAIYPVLIEKCKYTSEFIFQDKRAPRSIWLSAAKDLGEQEALAEYVIHADDETGKEILRSITDQDLLGKIVHECKSIHLQWCAAWRAQNPVWVRMIESRAVPKGKGHLVFVPEHGRWASYEEKCIRCGAVYGCEHISDPEDPSTYYYGKPYDEFQCKPDMPILPRR